MSVHIALTELNMYELALQTYKYIASRRPIQLL